MSHYLIGKTKKAAVTPKSVLDGFGARCTFTIKGDILTGECKLRLPDGTVKRIEASEYLTPIVNNIYDRILDMTGGAPVGGWWSSVKGAVTSVANKVAKNRVVGKLWDYGSTALQNPTVQSFIADTIPGGNTALSLGKKAASLIQSAQAGDEYSLGRIANAKQLADQGVPAGQDAYAILRNVYAMMQQQMPQFPPQMPQYPPQMPQFPQYPQFPPQMPYYQMAQPPRPQYPQFPQFPQQYPSPYGGFPQYPRFGAIDIPPGGSGGAEQIEGQVSYDVGNWFYNRPYRGNLAALSMDKSNPRHILRKLYADGMG